MGLSFFKVQSSQWDWPVILKMEIQACPKDSYNESMGLQSDYKGKEK